MPQCSTEEGVALWWLGLAWLHVCYGGVCMNVWHKWRLIDSSKLWHETDAQLVQLIVVCFLAGFEGVTTLPILFMCGYCRRHLHHHLCGSLNSPSIFVEDVGVLEFRNALV